MNVERGPVRWGVGMLGVTLLALAVDVAMLRGVVAFGLMLIALRGVVAVWTLGFVRPGARVEAVRSRANLYLLGALGLVCSLTLLG